MPQYSCKARPLQARPATPVRVLVTVLDVAQDATIAAFNVIAQLPGQGTRAS